MVLVDDQQLVEELPDRTLIWNQNHLWRIVLKYETHHNQHRAHRSLNTDATFLFFHYPNPDQIILAHNAWHP
jgi:hypothetical protein